MKNLFFVILTLIIAVSCTSKQEQVNGKWPYGPSDEFKESLTSGDTLSLTETCTQIMQYFKDGQNEVALSQLYQWNEGNLELIPLSDECKNKLNKNFVLFPVENFELNSFEFNLPDDNTFSFDIIFTAVGSDGSPKEGRTKFGLCPVRKDDKWFLTVKGMEHGLN